MTITDRPTDAPYVVRLWEDSRHLYLEAIQSDEDLCYRIPGDYTPANPDCPELGTFAEAARAWITQGQDPSVYHPGVQAEKMYRRQRMTEGDLRHIATYGNAQVTVIVVKDADGYTLPLASGHAQRYIGTHYVDVTLEQLTNTRRLGVPHARPADVSDREASRVVLDALTAAYRDIHAILDGQQPSADHLSRTQDQLAAALKARGSSGAQALGATDRRAGA